MKESCRQLAGGASSPSGSARTPGAATASSPAVPGSAPSARWRGPPRCSSASPPVFRPGHGSAPGRAVVALRPGRSTVCAGRPGTSPAPGAAPAVAALACRRAAPPRRRPGDPGPAPAGAATAAHLRRDPRPTPQECVMRVGVPAEVKDHEYRVAITPSGVHELRRARARGRSSRRTPVSGSSITDEEFVAAGATIVGSADDVWARGRPAAQGQGAGRRGVPPHARRPGAVHLPAPRRLAALHRRAARPPAPPRSRTRPCSCPTARCRCSPRCPRSPAGWRRRSARTASSAASGGRGVLMGGVSGVYAAKVVVLGAGVSGMNAAAIALGMQAEVLLLDKNVAQAARGRPDLPGPPADRRLQRLRGRAGRARRRPRHRRRARARAPRRRR